MTEGNSTRPLGVMKLSLRDLFWLVLAVASLAAWGIEHRKAAEDLRVWRMRSWFVRERNPQPSPDDRQRITATAQLGILTDEQLEKFFVSVAEDQRITRGIEYEPCLQEMARRGMSATLLKHYDEIMEEARRPDQIPFSRFRRNLEVLTALRISQEKPDPLRIDVTLSDRWPYGDKQPAPVVMATVTNVDYGQEPVDFLDGGDDRGGRRDRWKLVLTDEHGQKVPDSNFFSSIGGGVAGIGPLPFGKQGNRLNVFDVRRYVSPPRSGRYQLQLLYHNQIDIASEPDLTGLIVSKSEPIWVTVHNPDDPGSRRWMVSPHPALAILAAGGILIAMSIFRPARSRSQATDQPAVAQQIGRRDLAWMAVIVSIAIAFWFDSLYQASRIHRLIPDADARWTIEPTERPGGNA